MTFENRAREQRERGATRFRCRGIRRNDARERLARRARSIATEFGGSGPTCATVMSCMATSNCRFSRNPRGGWSASSHSVISVAWGSPEREKNATASPPLTLPSPSASAAENHSVGMLIAPGGLPASERPRAPDFGGTNSRRVRGGGALNVVNTAVSSKILRGDPTVTRAASWSRIRHDPARRADDQESADPKRNRSSRIPGRVTVNSWGFE